MVTSPNNKGSSFKDACDKRNLDMSLNSINFNRLINKKRNIDAGWHKPTFSDIPSAPLLD